jgi:parallel beta-helix repeat protein
MGKETNIMKRACALSHTNKLKWLQTVLASALLAAVPFAALAADTVLVPAGSIDALADAIAAAGPHGTVVLEAGLHTESGPVTIGIPVSIIGEEGAVLEVATVPDDTPPYMNDPALYIFGTHHVVVEGLTLVPKTVPANLGIVVQDSSNVSVRNNTIADFDSGIFVHRGDRADISGNLLEDMRFGVIVLNGAQVHVSGNTIRRMEVHGVWLCDAKGQCQFNDISETVVGILLCRLDADFIWPDGSTGAAEQSATQWHVANNTVHDNFIGIVATDGANRNLINNNDITSSELEDILLEEEFVEEDGTVYPPSFKNIVTLGKYKDVSVWDFGVDNRINGVKK